MVGNLYSKCSEPSGDLMPKWSPNHCAHPRRKGTRCPCWGTSPRGTT
uniref:Uncharacterized protein n=1 Tax=Arundo donax TaxID=35708 RepID=A0A0A9FUS5_ARUDO